MQYHLRDALSNIKGGLTGVVICLIITELVYGITFMAAFGNDTLSARHILAFAGIFFLVANPLWTIPLSYILGSCFLFSFRSFIHRDRRE